MLVSLIDSKSYEAVKNDLIGTISANIDSMFNNAVVVKLEETDGGGLKLAFSIPGEEAITQSTIYLPSSIVSGKTFLNKK